MNPSLRVLVVEDSPEDAELMVLELRRAGFGVASMRVASGEAKSEETCRNLRHDFYISYPLTLPERIYNGPHTFQLTVEDLKSQKIGQQTIDFTIIDARK